MLAVLGDLVRNLVIVIFLNALLEMLLPQGEFRRYIRLVTGLIVILMIVSTIAVLLGKLPRLEPVFADRPAAVDGGAMEDQFEKIGATHRRQVLQQCRDALEESLREEIAAAGEWELVEAVIILDEDEDSTTFGTPQQIDLLVKASAANTGRVDPVSIDPVKVKKPGSGEDAGPAARLPELEQALAGLLELSPARVTVSVGE